jgi:glycosyltransferase involved in cell wall biosynthesis
MLLHKSVEFDSRVRREASSLAGAGHEVIVLELAPVAGDGRRMDGFERRSVLPPAALRRWLPFQLYRIGFLISFVGGVIRARPAVVHAHDAAMLVPGAFGARLCGARLVYDSHELATGVPYRERGWAWLVGMIERATVSRCAAVITVSDGIAVRLQQRYGLARRPAVVRNVSALSPGGQGGLRRRLGIDAGTPLVLHQGAPAPGRGCEVLLAAVASLPGVRLVFLGDPEPGYGSWLADEIARRGLGERVTTLASVPLSELLAHTTEADAGVTLLQDTCENHRLALPNKLFEYVAAGVPVIAGALPEAQALVEAYGIGWCVRPDDPAAVAGAIEDALSARGDRALRERLRHAASELSWSVEQARLRVVYAELDGSAG